MSTTPFTDSERLPSDGLAEVLKGIATPERLRIFVLLRGREMGPAALEAALGLPRPQVQRHLRALQKAGLVTNHGPPRGRGKRYRVDPGAVEALNASYLHLLGHSTPRGYESGGVAGPADTDDLTLPVVGPPPESCQTCRHSFYVLGLVETLQEQLEESRRYQTRLRDLSSQVLTAHEEERKRIARELHDDTAQALTSLLVRLRLLERSSKDESLQERFQELRELTSVTLEGVRRMALDLRPSALDDLGLVPALQWYTELFAQTWNVRVEFRTAGLNRRLPVDLELVLYRVAQEAVTNIAKHAGASRVAVELERHGLWVRLKVEDDGKGFEVQKAMSSKKRGLGLFGMQERLALVGGRFDIESEPGNGTRLTAEVPLRHPPPTIGG
ncbi:MAG: ArsR family transcriptional regulator [Chloroflexi bacterium]|nr:ArsR family transcriptional regulator [Chloroflexota bacterium]